MDRNDLGATIAKSDLEIDFLALLDANTLPGPLLNEPIGPDVVLPRRASHLAHLHDDPATIAAQLTILLADRLSSP